MHPLQASALRCKFRLLNSLNSASEATIGCIPLTRDVSRGFDALRVLFSVDEISVACATLLVSLCLMYRLIFPELNCREMEVCVCAGFL